VIFEQENEGHNIFFFFFSDGALEPLLSSSAFSFFLPFLSFFFLPFSGVSFSAIFCLGLEELV
jgi:hypothetical protein